MPLQPVLMGMMLGTLGTDRGGKEGVSMNGAGNIAGLIDGVLPAAQVVHRMVEEAAELLSGGGALV